jgi:lysophospholipase L1-like esterase
MRATRPALLVVGTLALGLALGVPVVPLAPAPGAEQATAAQAAKPKPKPKKYLEYVALGDSWTADVVLLNADGSPATAHAPIDCAQSHRNYPKLVAKALGVTAFRDASCGSATTDDFARPQEDLPLGGTNPPQFDRLTTSTDLVTVGIGGNDAGIAAAGLDCLSLLPAESPISDGGYGLPFGGCKAKYTRGGVDRLSRRIKAAEPKLVRAFRAIHRLAPKARVLAVDYMSVVPDHACYPRLPALDVDMAYIHAKFIELNAMVRRAARRGDAAFVNTYHATKGHDLCRGPRVRYAEVVGLSVNDLAVGVPAHPNSAGARAQAATVLRHVRSR